MYRFPCYRFIPIEKYRDYAAVTYFDSEGPKAVYEYIGQTGRFPKWKKSTFDAALHAALECGDDRLAREIAEQAISVFPESILGLLALSDIARFCGNYNEALEFASRARLSDPASEDAASREVELAQRLSTANVPESATVAALHRFPLSSKVLWAVCKGCASQDYFNIVYDTWRGGLRRPNHAATGVRQMANAAIRAERFEVALDLYSEGCLLELRGLGLGKKLPQKNLEGKGGLSVIRDIQNVLTNAEIPYFLAAGTALGVVRDGRPLDHDSDIDIGIFEEHWRRESLVKLFREDARFDFDSAHPRSTKIGLVHRGGAAVDVFKFYNEGDAVYHDAAFVRWKNSPFDVTRKDKGGFAYCLPEDADRYLSENYGEWRVPDSDFDAFVDGPNVEVTWPEYFVAHRMRRAYKYVRALDLVKAHEELEHIEQHLMKLEIGRQLVIEMKM